MYDYWKSILRREEMKDRQAASVYSGGYVADLPHPYQTSTGATRCEVCGGHYDRRIHDAPWMKPVYGPCRTCGPLLAAHPGIECEVCGDTRLSFHRTGVEYAAPLKPKRERTFRPGRRSARKWNRRKGHWMTKRKPRPMQKQELRAEWL
jgi:hypothetical protein